MCRHWIDRAALMLLALWLGGCSAPALLGPEDAAPQPAALAPAPVAPVKPALPPELLAARDLAVEALQRGDFDDARETLDLALVNFPDQPLLLLNRGIAEHGRGDVDAARADFAAVLQLRPGNPVAHNHLGMLARAEGDFSGARAHYEAALASAPQHALAHRNLAILCDLYLQQLDCALSHYRAYLQAAGEDKQVQRWVTDLSRRAGG